MIRLSLLAFLSATLLLNANAQDATKPTEPQIAALLDEYNVISTEKCRRANLASWNVATDVGNSDKEKEKVRK